MKKVKALIIAAVMLVCANSVNAQSNVKNLNYDRGYRFDIELSCSIPTIWEFSSSHGYSFGNGLYVGGGAGFYAEFLPDYNYVVRDFRIPKNNIENTIPTIMFTICGFL